MDTSNIAFESWLNDQLGKWRSCDDCGCEGERFTPQGRIVEVRQE